VGKYACQGQLNEVGECIAEPEVDVTAKCERASELDKGV